MSSRPDKISHRAPENLVQIADPITSLTGQSTRDLFLQILNEGLHGLCFSLYEEGQKPGDIISEAQIRRKIEFLKPYTQWVRTFSTTEGNELIPKIAREYGLKTLVGAWLGREADKNAMELQNLIDLAKEGYVDVAAVGNEVLYRKDLTESELLEYIRAVKKQLPSIPVGYVDAYYEFVERPEVARVCDMILCNCYPYWEGTSFEQSFNHMRWMHGMALQAAEGKPVLITETGWPSQGEAFANAVPSPEHAMKYFINTQLWARENNIGVFYFSSFDESWKVGAEGEVGAYWGIWDSKGNLKY